MTAYWYAVTLTAAVFVATSIDDFMFVVCLLSGAGTRPGAVILAKLLNALLVVAIAALFVACTEQINDKSGLIAGGPSIALGLYRLFQRLAGGGGRAAQAVPMPMAQRQTSAQSFWGCSLVFAASSIDNVAGYAALFAGHSSAIVATSMAVILGMSVALCCAAYLVVTSQWRVFRRTWRFDGLIPYLLICLGIRAIVAVHL